MKHIQYDRKPVAIKSKGRQGVIPINDYPDLRVILLHGKDGDKIISAVKGGGDVVWKLRRTGKSNVRLQVLHNYSPGEAPIQEIRQHQTARLKMLTRAARGGNGYACFRLGCSFLDGNGVIQSDENAFDYFESAVAKGYLKAYANLGTLYLEGRGVETDKAMAIKVFQEGAEKGDTMCLNNLAACYLNGSGVSRDEVKGLFCLRKSAKLGNELAIENLAKVEAQMQSFRENAVEGVNEKDPNTKASWNDGMPLPTDAEADSELGNAEPETPTPEEGRST